MHCFLSVEGSVCGVPALQLVQRADGQVGKKLAGVKIWGVERSLAEYIKKQLPCR